MNVHGLPRRNVPNDLHMEHFNRICKEAIRGLGVNKTDRAISRVAKSLGTLSPVLDQYDLVKNVPDTSSIHKAPISRKDRDMLFKKLIQSDIFTEYAVSSTHPSFSRPHKLFYVRDFSALTKWMENHITV